MTNLTFKPVFFSAFSAYTDDANYLFRTTEISCQEIQDRALIVVRTHQKSVSWLKQKIQLELPKPLQIAMAGETLCLWVSPDEFWLLLSYADKDKLLSQNTKGDIKLVDSSGAYGLLNLSGEKSNLLLGRLIAYDIEAKLPVGKTVSTTLLQSQVVLFKNEVDSISILVRHSFANYVASALMDAVKRI